MKKGEMEFNEGSYLSIHAVPCDNPQANSIDSIMIDWANADEFSQALRKAADFIDKYKAEYAFDVQID